MAQSERKKVGYSFFYHLAIFIILHVLFAWTAGVIPASDLPSGSYAEHILHNIWSQGVDIYLNDKLNMISRTWKTVLIIHGIIDLSYLLFPSNNNKHKSASRRIETSGTGLSPFTNQSNSFSVPPKKEKRIISTQTAWIFILIGGALEIVWASSFKYNLVSPIIVLAALLISFDLIIRASTAIPIGTVYGVFTGIGTVGLVVTEAIIEGYIKPIKVIVILLLLAFIILLKLTGSRKERI